MPADSYQAELFKIQLEIQQQVINHISDEIHNNIGQMLSLVRLHLSVIPSMEHELGESKIQDCKELLDESLEDLRRLSKRLDIEFVKSQPLSTSISKQMSYTERTGLHAVSLKVTGKELVLQSEHKLVLFRIFQELICNAVKSSDTTDIVVILNSNGRGIQLQTIISFQNIDIKSRESELDITNQHMFIRAELIGATMSTLLVPPSGLSIELSIFK